MAYNPNNLSALTYANGFTLWHYKTPDAWAEVVAPGYFNAEAPMMLRVGDFMFVNTSIRNGTVSGVIVVLSRMNGDVVVGELVAPVTLVVGQRAAELADHLPPGTFGGL